ncbi:PHP domain-containing protein, partial [Xanthomonas citri pv. citri]
LTNGMPAYAELRCASSFSFLVGASHPQELVERAAQLGYSAIALTDECSVAGIVRAHVAAKECGLQLLVGAQLKVEPAVGMAPCTLTVLACDLEGYGNLCAYITRLRRAAPKGTYRLAADDLAGEDLEHCVVIC